MTDSPSRRTVFASVTDVPKPSDWRGDQTAIDPSSPEAARPVARTPNNIQVETDEDGVVRYNIYAYLCAPCCEEVDGIRVINGFADGVTDEKGIIHASHNTARGGGSDALKWDARLAEIGELHARDMLENDFFSHTGSDGRTYYERLQPEFGPYSSENIGMIEGVEKPSDAQLLELFDGWMHSPGHRRNIMDMEFTRIGIGTAGGNGKWLVAVEFADGDGGEERLFPDIADPYRHIESPRKEREEAASTRIRGIVAYITDEPVTHDIECSMEYGCRQLESILHEDGSVEDLYDTIPSLQIEYQLPSLPCISGFSHELIHRPVGVTQGYHVICGFIGGDIASDSVVWQHGQVYRTIWAENLEACPYVGKTVLNVVGEMSGCDPIVGVAGAFSKQFRIVTVESIEEMEEIDSTRLHCSGGVTAWATDYYPYQVGDEVLIFAPGQDLELPFRGDSLEDFSPVYIAMPVRFGEVGLWE